MAVNGRRSRRSITRARSRRCAKNTRRSPTSGRSTRRSTPRAAARHFGSPPDTDSMHAIPTAASITAEWLTDILHGAGHSAVNVRSFTCAQIGTGQIGKCIRFALDLDGDDPTAPRCLVGKFPSDDPTSRATGVALQNYIKEVTFYRELRHRVSINT